jgi:predicted regulator of Ras-like GTPase activity (Roadblock/LC7/MglB family)
MIALEMITGKIDKILREFVMRSPEVEEALLISSQGQPLTIPLKMKYNSVLTIAGTMLHLAERIEREFRWQEIQQIAVRSSTGYITLIRCTEEILLLVKTAKAPLGFLIKDIENTIKTLQTELETYQTIELKSNDSSPLTLRRKCTQRTTSNKTATNLKLTPDFINSCQQELAKYIGPIASIICKRTLSKNSQIEASEFVKILAKHIRDRQQALEFQNRFFS